MKRGKQADIRGLGIDYAKHPLGLKVSAKFDNVIEYACKQIDTQQPPIALLVSLRLASPNTTTLPYSIAEL